MLEPLCTMSAVDFVVVVRLFRFANENFSAVQEKDILATSVQDNPMFVLTSRSLFRNEVACRFPPDISQALCSKFGGYRREKKTERQGELH